MFSHSATAGHCAHAGDRLAMEATTAASHRQSDSEHDIIDHGIVMSDSDNEAHPKARSMRPSSYPVAMQPTGRPDRRQCTTFADLDDLCDLSSRFFNAEWTVPMHNLQV